MEQSERNLVSSEITIRRKVIHGNKNSDIIFEVLFFHTAVVMKTLKAYATLSSWLIQTRDWPFRIGSYIYSNSLKYQGFGSSFPCLMWWLRDPGGDYMSRFAGIPAML